MTTIPVSSSQIWPPPVVPRTLERQVWDSTTARGLPGVGKALAIYRGLIASCALQLVRGFEVLDTPRMLDRPDPDVDRPTWIGDHVEDYLLHGNAVHLVTVRSRSDGFPLAARWYPAHAWGVQEDQRTGEPIYTLYGREVPAEDIVHVRRGTDPNCRWRGVGIVEQHLRTLNRAGLQEAAESENLTNRNRPDVVIETTGEPTEAELDAAADKWVERFSGATPRPAFMPAGATVTPLSWNPTDGQMTEARNLTRGDIAGIFGLDGYWLDAPVQGSHTYKSPGPLFLTLVKLSLGPVMDPFEDVWSNAWLPGRAQRVRFNRTGLLADDLGSMIQAFNAGSRFFPDPNEPRIYMGFPPLPDDAFPATPVPPAPPADTPTPADDPADTPEEIPA